MKKETYLKYRALFEQNYKEQIRLKKHDLQYVNLYDLKTGIRSFELFIFIYSSDIIGAMFTNDVNSIDKRKRFFVKNNAPVLKVMLPHSKNYMCEIYPKHFAKVVSFYYGL